ncbi:MAG: flagellar hook-associated protein FlgK [Lachnospiraceae bacterium]|nr:flagellar hook-associated protein FlgK [Lachnospiraceae bacterium]
MPSTFFGLSIASTGLNAFQASVNTTTNNISNAKTDGYSRQQVNLSQAEALRTYMKYGTIGTGVSADSVTQVRDQYYDEKYWNNQKNYGQYEKQIYYLNQIQDYFKDTSAVPGFTSLYTKMFASLDTLKTNSGATAVRKQFISNAEEMMSYFNSLGTRLQDLQTSINDEIKTTIDTVNATSKKIAILNKQINTIEVQGSHANDLRDQRALLIDSLAKIVPVEVKETPVVNSNYPDMYTGATNFVLRVNGKILIDNYDYTEIGVTTRDHRQNQADVDGLYDLVWGDTGEHINMNASNMTGSLKAMFMLRDGNNAENLSGNIFSMTSNTVTIKNPSIKDVEYMNMPESGIVIMEGVQYPYSSFKAETDADGKITSYTFTLEKVLDADTQAKISGGRLEVGTTLNYKGLAYYQNQMSLFLRSFAKQFNDIEKTGKTLDGDPMESFFVADNLVDSGQFKFDTNIKNTTFDGASDTYYKMTALSCSVNEKSSRNPGFFATAENLVNENTGATQDEGIDAHSIVEELLNLQSNTKIFRDCGGDEFLQVIYSDITVDTQESTVFSENYADIAKSINLQRQGVSGVDEDDEALDLVKFKNAYNLASKAISVLAEMYDRLITQTGV